jgi:hypothetical protein
VRLVLLEQNKGKPFGHQEIQGAYYILRLAVLLSSGFSNDPEKT